MNRTIKVFGPFELDLTGYTLTRNGHRVRISGSQMKLLALLVARPGELVTREQIASLWTEPQAVDIRQGINTAVTRLRAVLGDDPTAPTYVETVIGKGYRFIEQVSELSNPEPLLAGPSTTILPNHDLGPPGLPLPAGYGMNGPMSSVIALPSAPVREKLLAGNALLLTSLFLAIVSGAALVFRHVRPVATPTRGVWNEQQITTNDVEVPVDAAALAPDGRLLAYMDTSGLFLREMATGRTRKLKGPALRPSRLVWFPDQTGLLVTGYATGSDQPEIWRASISGDPILFHRAADSGTVSPDGQAVAFLTDGGIEIHVADLHGPGERVLARTPSDEPFSALFWSADGKRIGYIQRHSLQNGDVDIESNYQWTYVSRELRTGREISSVRDMFFQSATETADGQIFFLRSTGGIDPANRGIWRMRIDSTTGVPLDAPVRICCAGDTAPLSSLTVAADGRQVMAIKELWFPNISVAELRLPGPTLDKIKRLTLDNRSDFPHTWSVDNQTIYFESDQVNSRYHIFRQRIDQSYAEMLTVGDKEQFFPAIVSDGANLVFEQWEQFANGKRRAIYRANIDGSDVKSVWNLNQLDEWRCPLTSGSCVLRESSDREFVFYKLDLVGGRKEELARCTREPTLIGDWSLSPDGNTAAIPVHVEHSPAIRLVRLDGSSRETTIHVRQTAQLRGIHWTPKGEGFYAGVYIAKLHWLEFIALSGKAELLRHTGSFTFGVPSRDGKKLAFVDSSISRNVFAWNKPPK